MPTRMAAQGPAGSGAEDKALLDQLTQVSRGNAQHGNIDPAIAGPPPGAGGHLVPMSADGPGAGTEDDDKKGGNKRELSTSKRAAQNRAAQRAFRQRKEGHIKKLEEQVRDYSILLDHYKRQQSENYALRDYIIALQSRLIEHQGDFPAPPLDIDLHAPRDEGLPPGIAPPLVDSGSSGDAMQGVSGSGSGSGPLPGSTGGNLVGGGGGRASRHHAHAPTANMHASPAAAQQLQASAAQAQSIEERTDPALKS